MKDLDKYKTSVDKKLIIEHAVDCEDCGKRDVVNRRVNFRSIQKPYRHWRISCNCGLERLPTTGEFLHRNSTQISEFYRPKKINKSKSNDK